MLITKDAVRGPMVRRAIPEVRGRQLESFRGREACGAVDKRRYPESCPTPSG